MNVQPSTWRRRARDVARLGTAASATMFVVAVAATLNTGVGTVSAAENGGAAVMYGATETGIPTTPLNEGGSATPFTLKLPDGAACTGDSVTGGYRVQSYMVPASVDPASLTTWGIQGPTPLGTGANYRQALFTTAKLRYVNDTTDLAATPNGPGPVTTLPAFDFTNGAFATGIVADGVYNLGIACTKDNGATLDRYWNVQVEFVNDDSDTPSGLRWVVPEGSAETTTTTSTTTTTTTVAGATTSTTVAGATSSTTVTGATTTTPSASSTTTTVACPTTTSSTSTTSTTSSSTSSSSSSSTTTVPCASTTTSTTRPSTTVAFGSGAGSGSGSGSGSSSGIGPTNNSLATTGSSSSWPIVLWGALLLVFGRMAILLGRKPEVLPARR